MAALDNPRHETFAQELFKGATADQAYQNAGYKPNRHNAANLARKQHIKTRVFELQQKASMRAEITAADVTKELQRYAEALARYGIEAADKGEVGVFHQHLNTARQCMMDLAKLNGWIVDRAETDNRHAVISAEPEPVGDDAEDAWASKQRLQ